MRDVIKLFEEARAQEKTGFARKSRLVDARPAVPGEVIETVIAGEGVETVSSPAKEGDMVVRNRCPATGNEEILVSAKKFEGRYEGPLDDAAQPMGSQSMDSEPVWSTYRPLGVEMAYFIIPPSLGSFTFLAPWGEQMIAHPGDAIVQDPRDTIDTYRIAAAAFACTYEIIAPAAP
ncbi:MAG: hypothetical protein H6905_09020 [Hyphomicrobiales bacterium]|nr:hypothetical protein [Hyphomicrobiales bacterium]